MSSLLCKLMNTILGVLGMVTEAVTYALKGVGEIVGDLIEDVGTSIGNVFGSGNFLLYGAVGLGAYLLLTKKRDESKTGTPATINVGQPSNGNGVESLAVGGSSG